MRARFPRRGGKRFAVAATCVATIFAFVTTATPASGYLKTVAGQVVRISPPPSVVSGALPDATRMFAFEEQQNVTLAAPMKVDAINPGTYTDNVNLYVAAGTVVDSHYIHSARTSTGTTVREGTVTFASDIVGVIGARGKLDSSDVLGVPTTNYGGAYPSREWEFGATNDWFQIVDARTLFMHANTTTVVDQLRVLTKHNVEPTVSAGASYSGYEGASITLNGTASDPDNDTLSINWTFVPTGDPGVMCTPTNVNTLTPSITCTDDATVAATLSVSDPYHPAVTSSTTISVVNRAPTITSLSLPTGQLPQTATVNLSSVFADAGSNDTHTAAINWGDTNTTAATVAGYGATGSHVYTASGSFTVTLTVNDDDLGTVSLSGTVHVNGPPTGAANGPYTGTEGSPIPLSGTASDADSSITTTWAFTPSAFDAGTDCTPPSAATLTPSVTCTDDAIVDAQLTVDDGLNAPVVSNSSVAVENAPPLIGTASATGGPFVVGQSIPISASFTDPGINDTHTALINWGDSPTTAGSIVQGSGTGTASGSHAYATPGVKTITIFVTDDDGASDSVELTVVVNTPPTVDAAGPYSGFEGTANTLGGSASDVDGDDLDISWDITWTGSGSGVDCTTANTTTVTPSVTCNDDTVVTAVLTVDDGVNPPVSSTATLTVGNAQPTGGPITASPLTVGVNATVNVSLPFSDPGTNDTHTATISWGDSTSSTGTVTELLGAGSVTGSHTYPSAGSFTISVTITDDDDGTVTITALSNVAVNGPPVVDVGDAYSGAEGSAIGLSATVTDPDNTPTRTWSFSWIGSGSGVVCTTTGTATLTPSVTCNDNTLVTAVLTANDGVNAPVSDAVTVTVSNVAPVVGAVTPATPAPIPVGTAVTTGVSFSDAGTHDTHTASVTWDDAAVTTGTVTETNGAGSVSASHTYTEPGIYQISITVTDDDGDSAVATMTGYVVVYDASGGRITGGMNFPSPSGSYTPDNSSDTDFTGDAHVGFNVRYQNAGSTVPTGQADFRFNAANLDFDATGFTWLVVENSQTRAYFRGTGTVNGVAGYDFLVSVLDELPTDAIRIQVTNHSTGEVLYDLQPGDPDNAVPTTAVDPNGIQLHP